MDHREELSRAIYREVVVRLASPGAGLDFGALARDAYAAADAYEAEGARRLEVKPERDAPESSWPLAVLPTIPITEERWVLVAPPGDAPGIDGGVFDCTARLWLTRAAADPGPGQYVYTAEKKRYSFSAAEVGHEVKIVCDRDHSAPCSRFSLRSAAEALASSFEPKKEEAPPRPPLSGLFAELRAPDGSPLPPAPAEPTPPGTAAASAPAPRQEPGGEVHESEPVQSRPAGAPAEATGAAAAEADPAQVVNPQSGAPDPAGLGGPALSLKPPPFRADPGWWWAKYGAGWHLWHEDAAASLCEGENAGDTALEAVDAPPPEEHEQVCLDCSVAPNAAAARWRAALKPKKRERVCLVPGCGKAGKPAKNEHGAKDSGGLWCEEHAAAIPAEERRAMHQKAKRLAKEKPGAAADAGAGA